MTDQDPIDPIVEKYKLTDMSGWLSPADVNPRLRAAVAEARADEQSKLPEIKRLAANEAVEKAADICDEQGRMDSRNAADERVLARFLAEQIRSFLIPAPAEKPEPPQDAEAKLRAAIDCAEYGWTIIANAGGGDWEKESKDWQEAATRFRNQYYKLLDMTKSLRQTEKPEPTAKEKQMNTQSTGSFVAERILLSRTDGIGSYVDTAIAKAREAGMREGLRSAVMWLRSAEYYNAANEIERFTDKPDKLPQLPPPPKICRACHQEVKND